MDTNTVDYWQNAYEGLLKEARSLQVRYDDIIKNKKEVKNDRDKIEKEIREELRNKYNHDSKMYKKFWDDEREDNQNLRNKLEVLENTFEVVQNYNLQLMRDVKKLKEEMNDCLEWA